MSNVSMRQMLEAGVHFGHQTRFWHPKMRPYIFGERNRIHIINLEKTLPLFNQAMAFLKQLASNGGTVLFVGTKKQAGELIAQEAVRAGTPYVSHRWLGGMLTNWRTVRKSIERLKSLESTLADPMVATKLSKKERLELDRERIKLEKSLGGIKNMDRLPAAMFIVDPHKEDLAVKEARKVGIPIVAMVDTNCDPDPIDYIIPCNDDAIRSIRLITAKMADAVAEGQNRRETSQADQMRGGRYDAPEPEVEEEPVEVE